MSNPEGPKGPQQIQLQIDDQVGQGSYSNLVVINHSENEFILDFAFLQPGAPFAKVRSRIISSPRHAKRMIEALQRNLEAYESRFGKIESLSDDPKFFH